MSKPRIECTPRHIVEGQLLTALDDKNKVGIVVDEHTLEFLISAVGDYYQSRINVGAPIRSEVRNFWDSLRSLRQSAFGKKAKRGG